MKLTLISPVKSLSKAYLKQSLKREQIELFKANLTRLFERICTEEHEEHLKNIVSDLLKDTWYKQTNEINTSGRADLVIHNGKSSSDSVGVIIETKKPSNKSEMITPEKPNAKALHELLHYYMQERYIKGNQEIKRLIVCNIFEWYIFDAADFERFFFSNQKLVKSYKEWNDGLLVSTNTDWFYQEVAKPFIEKELEELPCVCFDLRDFAPLPASPRLGEEADSLSLRERARERALINLYKILSPPHLLKQPFANDSNSLNKEFYSELLHIIGLEEVKEKGKKLIRRKSSKARNDGSLLENTINVLKVRNKIPLPSPPPLGEGDLLLHPAGGGWEGGDYLFDVALELCITWLNRILFLKLLEGQLVGYHKGDRSLAFLERSRIEDFDELNELFFEVLAIKVHERSDSVRAKFGNIPYLNSSLFEETDLERSTLRINELKNRLELPLHGSTVLKDLKGKRLTGKKGTLAYLFEFLDAYDFGAEGGAEIQEQNKSIINASVLGLIFEKINGYRDGSFFTPGFITMYICRETIRRSVVQKFNERFGWNCSDFNSLYNSMDKVGIKEANEVVNSLKICDPAVGSGHFLVSALNELIAVKAELGILADQDCKRLRGYSITIENDELIVTDEDQIFAYNFKNAESQRVQETLFHEKATIIENCLFGVDINPKSVAICRLRLWIELLKSAYYRQDAPPTQPPPAGWRSNSPSPGGGGLGRGLQLETLPNIDINIKCGNSLVSRFALGQTPNLPAASRSKLKELTEKYRNRVFEYKLSPTNKVQLRKVIADLKGDLLNFGLPNDKDLAALRKKENEVSQLGFAFDKAGIAAQQKIMADAVKLRERFTEKERLLYHSAFEWRFEFPEVLDDAGEFVGFDAVIGNPPYIRQESIKEQKPAFQEIFGDFYCGTADIYTYFYKTGLNLLRSGGNLCYIAPNKFMRAGYGKNTRQLLTDEALPLMVIDFGDLPIFDEATTYPSIVMVEKTPPSPTLPRLGRDSSSSPQRGEAGRGEALPADTEKKLFIPQPVPLPLLEAARSLRSNMTDAEQLLWGCLRRKQLGGYRFRRQHPVERFVLDFYCCETKLAVELDGGQHNDAEVRLKDQERTEFLQQQGIEVIRFWNNEVLTNTEGVLEKIYKSLQRRHPLYVPLPSPPPPGEGAISKPSSGRGANLLPQAGGGREGGDFLAATFTTTDQLSRFDQTLAEIGFTMPVSALKHEGWALEKPAVLDLMNKLRQVGNPLGEYVDGKFYYGIKTGLNDAFVIDKATRARLISEDPKSAELIKPWLRGRDIKKWRAEWAGIYIIAIASSGNKEWPWSQAESESAALTVFAETYPAIHRHLSQWEEPLRKRDDKGRFWWELRACAYWHEFEQLKIVYQEIATFQSFAYATEGLTCNNKCFLLPQKNDFLLGLLNSKLFWWYLGNLTSGLVGGARAMQMPYMSQLPIPATTETQQAPVIGLVQQILAAPGSPDVPRLEAETDRLVYELYGLTEEEIALVEGKG